MMSIIKMRGLIDVLFAFKIFSLPVPTRPGTQTFWQVPDPSRPEVKNPYPSDPGYQHRLILSVIGLGKGRLSDRSVSGPKIKNQNQNQNQIGRDL